LDAPEVMGSAALGVSMFSSWHTEEIVTVRSLLVGTPAGSGTSVGKA